jgi:hypothetical protein
MAVTTYLEAVARHAGGACAAQQAWERVWTGYAAFATVGDSLDAELEQRLTAAAAAPPPAPATADALGAQLAALIAARAEHARGLHGRTRVGGRCLAALFDDPAALLAALVQDGHIVPGDPDASPFFRLLAPTAAMYKVFTQDEVALWRAWTAALGPAALAPATSTDDDKPSDNSPGEPQGRAWWVWSS